MIRNRKKALQAVKKLDAFPKTHEECVQYTSSGGTFSLFCFMVMIVLLMSECAYFCETNFTFKFDTDTDFREKLNINIDITVAMPCSAIGADVLDVTGQQVMSYGELKMEETWFELDSDQLVHFQGIQRANSYLREQFHSVHQVLWRSGYINLFGGSPQRRRFPNRKKDACRLSGKMTLNKVAGNFHITAVSIILQYKREEVFVISTLFMHLLNYQFVIFICKTIPLPRGHAHIAVFMDDRDYNFSHRIEKFSFGEPSPGIIHPLEGDEQITDKNKLSYQYFITVVPTRVNTYTHFGNSFQYSVTEQSREISHDTGSHGTPGIFFKYDVSALKVNVREEHEPFLQFLTRLIGIIGGVFTCSGLLHRVVGVIVNCCFCRYFHHQTKKEKVDKVSVTLSSPKSEEQTPIISASES